MGGFSDELVQQKNQEDNFNRDYCNCSFGNGGSPTVLCTLKGLSGIGKEEER